MSYFNNKLNFTTFFYNRNQTGINVFHFESVYMIELNVNIYLYMLNVWLFSVEYLEKTDVLNWSCMNKLN